MPPLRAHPARLSAKILRTALDQAVDAIVIADATGRIVYANPATEPLVGQPAIDLIGRHFVVAVPEGDHAGSYESASEALGEGRSWSGVRVVRRTEGLHVEVDLVVSPVRESSGDVTHVLSIGRSRRGAADGAILAGPAVPRMPHGPRPRAAEPEQRHRTSGSSADVKAEIERIIRDRTFRAIFQPIVTLADGVILGYEGLTRFDDDSPPEARFVQAADCGLGLDLEQATLETVLVAAGDLPAGGFLSINVSPALVLEGVRLKQALSDAPRPVVLEITERERVDDYAELRAAIARIGVPLRWAIDDAGAGFASLRHILELRPQFVKLDRGLIAGIALDPIRQALAVGLLHFATALGTTLIAEGVETEAERAALNALGISTGQGFLFGTPGRAGGREG
ncbi:MAG TPA: EAL domain-containing protein [Candidatus Eisenbacteria bacterium]|nr:EAL domain-containing protein [Candidatus Eisenbacteria bacterium]